MTHREFLLWLRPQLEKGATSGLPRDAVRAIRDQLTRMREAAALQPFASRLYGLVDEHSTLDAKAVAGLVAEVRAELAPPREQTMVLAAADPETFEKPRG